MKWCGKLAVAVLLCVAASSPLHAQTPIAVFGAAGANLPMGDFGDAAETGWLVGGGILGIIGQQGLWLGAEGMFGQNSVKDVEGANFQLVGGGGMVGFTFNRASRVSPYVFGSAGVLSVKFDADGVESESESEFAIGGGAGLSITMSPRASFFANGRYIKAGDLSMLPLTAGILLFISGPSQ